MAAASSSSGGSFKYDVFINFRGEDTRRSFVCHLYHALKRTALHTFIDSEELQKGDDLSELYKAIQDSRLSILVFSKDYASSTWCLKELVQILECMDRQNQIVVPVFYGVDPSHVRKRKDSFAEAFAKHESHSNVNKEELESWKSSLTRATNLSGYDSTESKDDIELIKSIVEDILKKLIRISPIKTDGLIGMDTHMNKIDSLLQLGVDDCRVVGIWGMGGIGKSTIARAVYDNISPQFEHKCFLDNVKEGFLTRNGEAQMVEDLLCATLNVKDGRSLVGGVNMMRERLGKKKVLLVLDDVDAMEQIDTLIGENPSFGGGSRIIITTRDKKLLARFLVYEPKLFTTEKALELFRRYAFRTIKFSESYDEISRCAVKYAHGLPLALKVLGGLLDNKKVQEWEYELEKIKKIPLDNKIGRVLFASYDGLDECQKNIFLDIACFFIGERKEAVTPFHESCGFFPQNGLRVLEERSLITFSSFIGCEKFLKMHDLIQEMGRDIVYQESTRDPGRRSRLWYCKDVLQVLLAQSKPTEVVEGIILDLSKLKEELCVHYEAFVGMKRLRLLRLTCEGGNPQFACKQHVNGDLKSLSNELRVLVWHGYPLKSLPSDFQPTKLIKIDMCGSHIEQLWEGTKPLPNLVRMDLRGSRYLIKTPDLTEATNLKYLILAECTSLLEVHPSISALESLVWLDLEGCSNLRSLPSSIHMKSLSNLVLSRCSKLEEFPEISEVMERLYELDLDMTAIKELPSSINNLTGLEYLSMRNCTSLASLPDEICDLACLKNLDLTGCSNLVKFPNISGNMKELKKLCLDETSITEMPSSINDLSGLKYLSNRGCRKLRSLPRFACKQHVNGDLKYLSNELRVLVWHGYPLKSLPSDFQPTNLIEIDMFGSHIEQLWEGTKPLPNLVRMDLRGSRYLIKTPDLTEATNLKYLNLAECTSLLEVHPSISALESLYELNLKGCSNLVKFPNISGNMELTYLYLDETPITEMPSSINDLPELKYLSLRGCRELRSLPSSIHMKSLWNLVVSGCWKLEEFPEISEVMERLYLLDLDMTAVKELPSSINNLTGLEYLSMRNCTSLVSLPDEICDLACLKNLDLTGCSKLSKLPDNFQNWKSLGKFDLKNLEGSGIKQLPFYISQMVSLSCRGWKELTAPFSSWPTCMTNPSSSILVRLDLSGCNVLDLSDAIAHLSSLRELDLSGNNNLESLPEAMNRLGHLKNLYLKGCKGLKSIPELCSSIQRIDANNCTSLETISTPQLPCVGSIHFTFFNCLKLAKTNLFMDIAETAATENQGEDSGSHSDTSPDPVDLDRMCLPGSDIPDWFNHQDRGSSVTVQLPPDWSLDMSEGLAICAISNLRGADNRATLESAFCCATFRANESPFSFYFRLLPQYLGRTDVPLESDHMILVYINLPDFGTFHGGRKYTQARFRIATRESMTVKTWKDCTWITSCGVCLFQKNAPSSVDLVGNVENRETEISSKRKRETLKRGKEKMGVEVHEEEEECSGGPICSCFSLSGCTISLRKKQRETEREAEGVAGLESEEADFSGEGGLLTLSL